MKVLYISHHRQRSGSGEAARNYLRSLKAAGIEVSAKPIKLAGDLDNVPEDIRRMEETSSENCEVCIQHVLPHYLDYNGNFRKNIAVLITETVGWENSGWASYVNTMDEVWVPNADAKKYANIIPPIKVVPHASNLSKFDSVKPLKIPELEGGYTFYYIGEHNRRKRISAFIEAFHLEFSSNEPVNILLKVHKPNKPAQETFKEVVDLCNQIKSGLKLYPDVSRYHSEIVMAQYMSDQEILSLHKACDCFVLTSYGEAWSYPTFDAAALGKQVIAPCFGGPKDFLKSSTNHQLTNGDFVPCIGSNETFQFLNTGREEWYSVDLQQLRYEMRQAYVDYLDGYNQKTPLDMTKYSYKQVGELMKEKISEN